MGTIHYIEANGNIETKEAVKCPPLTEFQSFVEGYVEPVYVLFNDKRCVMFVNEDGHRLELPYNPDATAIYHEVSRRRGERNPNPILGNAVVLEDVSVD